MLKLNIGSKVRNISKGERKGWVGVVESRVTNKNPFSYSDCWVVSYHGGGVTQKYKVETAHQYLEIVEEPSFDFLIKVTKGHTPTKQVLDKERVNVLTGGTLSEAKKQLGDVRAYPEFHTRATGRTTGQAFGLISKAMLAPYKSHDMRGLDHHRNGTRYPDEHFIRTVKDLTKDLKGFSFTQHSIMFSPIVTQETYVEVR